MSGEQQLSEGYWRRVGMSESLRGRRLKEMPQLNAFSPKGLEVPFEFQKR